MNRKQFVEYAREYEAIVDDNLQYVDDHGISYCDPVIEVTEDIAMEPSHVGCWCVTQAAITPSWGWDWDYASQPMRVVAVPVMKTEWKVLNS